MIMLPWRRGSCLRSDSSCNTPDPHCYSHVHLYARRCKAYTVHHWFPNSADFHGSRVTTYEKKIFSYRKNFIYFHVGLSCELVDLLFSPVWVLGECLISLLGHRLKCLGTTAVHHLSRDVFHIYIDIISA